ncbi:MAG: hypothetical protein HQ541_21920, partial [Mariniphaga sp.]|nr:hypothetical protein [Mariniphaga sp.]
MTNAVNFVLESGISLALLSLIYILFLRKETFFRLNRVFILASLIFSIVLPFLIFRIYEPEPILLTEITVTPYRNLIEAVTVYGRDFSGTLEHVILSDNTIIYVYLGLVVFFLGRFLFRISRIFILIIKNPIENKGDYKLVVLNKEISPFSFLNYIFVGTNLKNTDGYPRMIAHEREHVKQGHSFDILIIEVLTALQWFNPFMWILKRVIRENHEFLADQAVIHSGVNFAQYKKLLLNQFVGGQLIITNNFNYSLIKTRIKMLSSIQSSRYAIVKLIFGIVIAMGLIIAFACEQKEMTELPLANQSESMKLSVIDGKLKIEGSFEELDKIKLLFSDNKQFEVGMDSLGNLELIKKKTANSEIQD